MDTKKELTKQQIVEAFKELILDIPFDKITIKMITDKVGIIRPTFYNHFQDKYEIVEWIFKKEIKEKLDVLIDNNLEHEVFHLLFSCMGKKVLLYRKLYTITGPNSFEAILNQHIFDTFLKILEKYPLKDKHAVRMMSYESIATYYTFGLADTLKTWITTINSYSAEDICEGYNYIIRHSFFDMIVI
ncbi:TetR/AcrR family transcriptional regulator C-terminal domain-containing protein [Lachnospiraceae bacterium LCP25S3_G4]